MVGRTPRASVEACIVISCCIALRVALSSRHCVAISFALARFDVVRRVTPFGKPQSPQRVNRGNHLKLELTLGDPPAIRRTSAAKPAIWLRLRDR